VAAEQGRRRVLAPYLGETPAAESRDEPEMPLDVAPSTGEAGVRIWI
jgi:hypothetical protein